MHPSSYSGTVWSTILLLSSQAAAISRPLRVRQLDNTTFDWTTIKPTRDLQYHPCYGSFQCARLELPLDYTKAGPPGSPWDSSSNNNNNTGPVPAAAIALVTLPATVAPTDPSYGGAILVNPGGPGGQGTTLVVGAGTILQTIVDVPDTRHYDIVGFDPRGIGLTTPSASCYSSEFARGATGLRLESMASVLTDLGLNTQFAANQGVGELCAQQAGGADSVFHHMSTASVARDMLEITQRIAELQRKGKSKRQSGKQTKTRLQYLGVSYGTYLGNTFASMFPGWVGRMVIDGVVDPVDYSSGTWAKNIIDGEAVVDVFYSTCFNASTACPLRQDSDTGPSDIRARVTNLIQTLRQAPAAAVYNGRPYTVTSHMISETIRGALYTPISSYAPLAAALADALAGNFSAVLAGPRVQTGDTRDEVCVEPASPAADPPPAYIFAGESQAGVLCGDSQAQAGERNLPWARTVVARIANQSVSLGEGWARIPLACAGWPFAPAYSFAGPFGSPAPTTSSTTTNSTGSSSKKCRSPGPDNEDNTPAAPLLILSTRHDHATPLENAFAVSRQHGGSAVVVLEAAGHCALLSSTSKCVYGHVREYFASGAVPANNTVCQPDCKPSIPAQACPGLIGDA